MKNKHLRVLINLLYKILRIVQSIKHIPQLYCIMIEITNSIIPDSPL